MIILGRKYKFTKFEKQRLKKNKIKTTIIRYANRDPKDVLEDVKVTLENDNYKTIVLNTKVKVDDDIIKFLTELRLENKVAIITIEHFLEKYLQKCYIPDDHINLDYLDTIKPFSTWQYIQKRVIDYIGVFSILLQKSV